MGKRNFSIDFIQIFTNIDDGEFFERVHHKSFGSGEGGTYPDHFPLFILGYITQSAKIFGKRIALHCFNVSVNLFLMIIFPSFCGI